MVSFASLARPCLFSFGGEVEVEAIFACSLDGDQMMFGFECLWKDVYGIFEEVRRLLPKRDLFVCGET